MKKYLLLICLIAAGYVYGQSSVVVGQGSSISVGNGSNVSAANRDGTLLNSGTFNSRSIVFDPTATAATSATQASFFANWNASGGAAGYKLDVSASSNFSSFISGYSNLDVGSVLTFNVNANLTSGTVYYYRLRAYDVDGITGYSNVISVTTSPNPPVASAATNVNESSFTANWASSPGATSYYLDVATDNLFSSMVTGWSNVNVGNVATYNVNSNLTAGTNFYYRIRAAAGSSVSTNSNTITVLVAPLPPAAIAATSLSQASFSANWNASAGATKYFLDVSTVNTFASFVTGWNSLDVGNVTTYSVNTNLAAGTTYYIRVRSNNGAGTSTNSNTITVLTVPPNPVASAAAAIGQTSFSANWSASTSAEKYYLDVSTDAAFAAGTFVTDYENRDVGNVITFPVNTNLSGGTTYYYRVRANNASGTSGNSGSITALTIPPNPVATAASVITQTSFSANWNASPSATKYYLDVSNDSGFGAGTIVTDYGNKDVGGVTTYNINTNLSAGTTYYYRLRASNASGTSGSSNAITILTAPPNPASLAATNVAGTSFDANWNSVTSATGYRLDVSTDAGFTAGNFIAGFENLDIGNFTGKNVSGLTVNTTYYYRVRAYNASGSSGDSGNITVLTGPPAPVATAASNLALYSFSTNWNAAAGSTGYYLDVSTDSNFGDGTFILGYEGRNVGNVTTYSISQNLNYGTTYFYRVRAFNPGGTGSNSNVITISTLPQNPIAAAATSIIATDFNANWNSTTGTTGYRLDVSSVSNFSSRIAGYDNLDVGNVTTYAVSGLTANTNYYYRVRAYNNYGTGGNSGMITVLTAPDAPVTIAASSMQTTNFTANWNALAGVSGYFLDVSTLADFSTFVTGFNSIDAGNVSTYLVSGLSPGVNYYYRIRAYNSGGTSTNSNSQSVRTLPTAPAAVSASAITGTSFSANWNSVSSATGYRLDVSTTSDFSSPISGYPDLDVGNVTTYSVTALTEGDTYYYRVRAYNNSGVNGNSNTITVKTTPPSPVAAAATSVTNNSFDANWNSSNGAAGYYIDVATDAAFNSYVAGFSNKNVGNVSTYSVTGLAENSPYYYRVRAYNSGGTSGNSGTKALTTAVNLVSAPAVSPASAITSTSFSANWNASTGATKYFLDVSAVSNFISFIPDWENVDVGNVVTFSVNTNLTSGGTYYYRVRAFNASGTSGNSNTITIKTIPPAPAEQAASSIAINNFDANWNASTGATGYYLDVATDAGFSTFVSGFNNRDLGNVLTYTVTGLTGGTQYFYRVRAYNTGGTSSNSGTIDPTTLAGGTVIATAASTINTTSFIANWNAYGPATGYNLDVSTSPGFGAGTFVDGFQNKDVANVTSYTVDGLSAGTNYYYRVTAYSAVAANIGVSGTINVITLPGAPTAAAASSFSEVSFNANWNASTSATGYYIDVATDNGFTSFVSGFNNKYVNNVTTFTVTGLTGGTTYYYQVRAKNGSGIGANSLTISAVTIPHKPSATYATALTNNSFSANWNTSSGAAGYKLDVSSLSNFGSFVGIYNNLDVNDVSNYSVVGLSGGTTYYYRVKAYNNSGTSDNSETIVSLTRPSSPTSAAASSIAKTSFSANWNSSVGATKYYLDVATTAGFNAGTFVSGYQNLDVGNLITYSITGLTGGTNYYYRVRAFNPSGTSGNSGTITTLTLPLEPGILAASGIESGSFAANWNASGSATGYKLDVSTLSNFTSFVGAFNNLDVGDVTTYSVTGLTGGTTYYFRVRAYNGSGISGNSESMSVTTASTSPVATAATSIEEINFNANWNSSAGADGYKLDVSTVSNFTSFLAGFNNKDVGSVTTYPVAGLTGSSTYYYRVRAYIGGRTSGNSNTITTLTKPPSTVATAATTIAETSFNANWNSVAGASKYFLEVSTSSDFSSYVGGFNNKDVGNVTTYSVTGLNAITTYYYRLHAFNASGTGDAANIKTVLTTPAAPTVNAATSITNSGFRSNWNATAGATGYRLDVSTVSNFATFVGIYNNKDVGNVTFFSISGLNGNTAYYYRVRAYNASGSGGNSGSVNLTTLVDPSGAPTTAAASAITQTSFSANWNTVAGAAGYKLDVSTDWNFGAGTFLTGFSDLDVANVITYPVAGLTAGTTYYYRVRSYNASGTSGNSGGVTVQTLPPTAVATAVTSLATTSLTANWNVSASATGYYLDVATDNPFTSFLAGFNNKDVSNVNTYAVAGLTSGTTYYIRVRAYNGSGAGGNSNVITALTIPSAPTATASSSVGETGFSSNWNSSTGAAGYRLDVSTDAAFGAGSWVTGYQDKDVGLVTTYSISGLTGGTNYHYRVRAYNASGISVNSNSITALTPPSSPTALAATTVTGTGFSANWNSVTGAAKYYLDVSTDNAFGGGTFVAGYNNKDVGNVTTSNVSGLSVNTSYYYRIRSFNASGASANSNIITQLTSPAAPTAAAFTSQGSHSFTANWNSVVGATGYLLDVSTDAGFGAGTFEVEYENRNVGNVVTFPVSNITGETTHYYRVRAYNNGGTGSNSGTITVLGIPFAVSATALTPTSFTANWDAVTFATGYRLDVSSDINFGAGTFLAGFQNKDVGNLTTYPVTGLTPYITYYYRLRSYDPGGSSGNSNVVIVKNIPAVPVAIAATNISQESYTARWALAGGSDGYILDVATDAGFLNFVTGFENKPVYNVTSFLVNGLSPGVNYYYRVRAYNTSGTTDNSNTINTITLPGSPVAAPPTLITEESFSANWNSVSGATGYKLDASTNSSFAAGTFVTDYQDKDVGNVFAFPISGLAAGQNYYYRVRAYNVSGTGSSSNVIGMVTIPPAPVATSATAITETGFTSNWNLVSGATGYYIDLSTDQGFTSFVSGYNNRDVSNVSSYIITGLSANTNYYFRIRGYNVYGTGRNSNQINVITISFAPEATSPTMIKETSFSANWNLISGTAGYKLDVSTNSSFAAGTFVTGYQDKDVGNVFTFPISGLEAGQNYYYRVRAYNVSGTGSSSNVISMVTIPPVPVATSATAITETGFTSNWNLATGATGYYIDLSTDAGFSSFVSGYNNRDVSNVSSYIITGLNANTTYYYRVRAYNVSGVSSNSNIITGMIIPLAPVAIAATNIRQTGFTANWTTTSDVDGYIIDVAYDAAFTLLPSGYQNIIVNNARSLVVTNMAQGFNCYYRVRAYTSHGISNNSNIISVFLIPANPIANPATLIQQTSFTANWKALSGVDGYLLDISTSENFADGKFLAGYNGKDVNNYTSCPVSNLKKGTQYYYRVKAYNASGQSGYSNTIYVTTSPNIKPVLLSLETENLNFTEGGAPILLTNLIVVSDQDDQMLTRAEVQIIRNYGRSEDILSFTNQNGISGVWENASGRMVLTGNASLVNYQTALRSITYLNSSIRPSGKTRTIGFIIEDSTSLSDTVSRNIKVNSINTPPVLSGLESDALEYKIKQGHIQLTCSISITDADDDSLGHAVIEISGNYRRGEDSLSCSGLMGSAASWDAASGRLTIAGNISAALYQNLICSVCYWNCAPRPTAIDRTISITYNDGRASSNTLSRKIKISSINSAPVLTSIEKSRLQFGLNSPPMFISDSLTVSDIDNADLFGAEIKITLNFKSDEDVLLFDGIGKINGIYNQSTGVLTLSGESTVASYNNAVRSVRYKNLKGSLATKSLKSIEFTVWDGIVNSNTEKRVIDVAGISTGVELVSDEIPTVFALHQNYPNPFNPSTKINFDIPQTCVVQIELFDVVGRKVATLLNGEKNAGKFSVQFNGAGLSSGIYFYRIKADRFIETKKMILMK